VRQERRGSPSKGGEARALKRVLAGSVNVRVKEWGKKKK
jgi:hypothetical protein